MHFYFQLQYQRFNRNLRDKGLHPYVGIILSALAFVAFSLFLFYKTSYAPWIYLFISLVSISSLNETKRIYWLSLLFNKKKYITIRLIENALMTIPFVFYLGYKQQWLIIGLLIMISPIMAILPYNRKISYTIPTPFYKRPFEFIVGFRQIVLLIPVIYFILAKAIEVGNYNLGVAMLGLTALIASGFYVKPENEYFVWMSHYAPRTFILKKIGHATLNNTLLCLPVIIILTFGFSDNILFTLGAFLVFSLWIIIMVLAKYSAYPGEINLPQVLLLGLCLWFPPMVIIVIPIFYRQAHKRLQVYLT